MALIWGVLVLFVAQMALIDAETNEQCAEATVEQLGCRGKYFFETMGSLLPAAYKEELKDSIDQCFIMCPNQTTAAEAEQRIRNTVEASATFKRMKKWYTWLASYIPEGTPNSATVLDVGTCVVHELMSSLPPLDNCSAAEFLNSEETRLMLRRELNRLFELYHSAKDSVNQAVHPRSELRKKLGTAARFALCYQHPNGSIDWQKAQNGAVAQCLQGVQCEFRAYMRNYTATADMSCPVVPGCEDFKHKLASKAQNCFFGRVEGALKRLLSFLDGRREHIQQAALEKSEGKAAYYNRQLTRKERREGLLRYRYADTKIPKDERRLTPLKCVDKAVGGPLSDKKDSVLNAISSCVDLKDPAYSSLAKMVRKQNTVWNILTRPLRYQFSKEWEVESTHKAARMLLHQLKAFRSMQKMAEDFESGVCAKYKEEMEAIEHPTMAVIEPLPNETKEVLKDLDRAIDVEF